LDFKFSGKVSTDVGDFLEQFWIPKSVVNKCKTLSNPEMLQNAAVYLIINTI